MRHKLRPPNDTRRGRFAVEAQPALRQVIDERRNCQLIQSALAAAPVERCGVAVARAVRDRAHNT
ncbi:MAG: hypothetical protein RML32_08340, partial [Gammaproteobacteria bacterium]|nr:hypothetical protein [Gammaproteobacteria bacterium]